jgi:hypothetical protein
MSVPKNQENVLDFANRGEIVDGVLEMPTLWSMSANGKYRYWNMFIGIEDAKETKIDVTEDYINRKLLPDGAVGCYWTISGQEGTENPIISEKTYVRVGKNVKSKNFTTPFTQAILDARTDYNLKMRKGQVENKEDLLAPGALVRLEDLISLNRGEKPWRVFAMALHDVNKVKNWRHVKYPCAIQPKLDGTMFVVVYHPHFGIDSYSRGRENYEGQEHILDELLPVLKKYPGLHLVGELWKKGYGLQDISGSSRRQLDSKIKEAAIKLDFNVFDCFYLHKEQTFEDRHANLDDLFMDLEDYNKQNKVETHVKLIETYTAKNKEQLLARYEEFLADNLEGAVIRNWDSLYEPGLDKEKRSYTTLKLKPRPDAEWPVIGFKDGNGKESGAVIWICAENDEGVQLRTGNLLPLAERKQFSVTPNMDYETRQIIFNKLSMDKKLFSEKIESKLLTINYSILSKDYLPQQPKAIRFREQSVNDLLYGN